MGGSGARTSSRRPGSGENTLVTCENGDYAADLEIARGPSRRTPDFPEALDAPEEVETPGAADDRGRLASSSASTPRRPRRRCRSWPTGRVVLALVRGDDRLNEMKLLAGARRGLPAGRAETRSARPSAPSGGSIGPVGVDGRGGRRRGAARGPVRRRREPRRRATCAASRPAATSRPRFADSARSSRRRRMPELRRASTSPDGDRGRDTSSSSRRGTRSRSRRRSSTRTAPSSRWSWAATGSAPAA